MTDKVEIARRADALVRFSGERDPRRLARELGVEILSRPFAAQKGAYTVIMRVPFIFLKDDLDPVWERIVLAHELGHHILHRAKAEERGGFREFDLFDVNAGRLEREANLFAAQLLLEDGPFLEYARRGWDTKTVAAALETDVNLAALKADILIARGITLRPQPHQERFLSA